MVVYSKWPFRRKSALYEPVTTKSADATLKPSEAGLIIADTDDITLTLPAASGNSGLMYIIKATPSVSTGITVDGNSSETIDGQTTQVLYDQYEVISLFCDGTGWHIV